MCIFLILVPMVAITWTVRGIDYATQQIGCVNRSWLLGGLMVVEVVKHPAMLSGAIRSASLYAAYCFAKLLCTFISLLRDRYDTY